MRADLGRVKFNLALRVNGSQCKRGKFAGIRSDRSAVYVWSERSTIRMVTLGNC